VEVVHHLGPVFRASADRPAQRVAPIPDPRGAVTDDRRSGRLPPSEGGGSRLLSLRRSLPIDRRYSLVIWGGQGLLTV
jgi:hypothetical protein